MVRTNKFFRSLRIVLLVWIGLFQNGRGDSPLTSTDFYRAYLDIETVERAAREHTLDEEIAGFLSSPENRIDIKAAVVNALSWGSNSSQNAAFYLDYLLKTYSQSSEADLIERLGGDELLCLGYLRALADYFHPENALPLLRQARVKNPGSFTAALILTLAEAEAAMGSDWCKVWRLTEKLLDDPQLQREMRPEATGIVEDYMIIYRDYCPQETGAVSSEAEEENPCARAQTQVEMNQCAIKEYEKADGELNRVYREVMAALRPEIQEKLKAAQRAWIAYRDAHCDCASFDYSGGSIYPLVYYNCLRDLTMARITEIQQLLQP